jgi:response regulator of citrate/malate metabolism
MSGQNTILTAANAAQHGAFDYLPKPFDIDALTSLVQRALKAPPKTSARAINPESQKAISDAGLPLIGRSDAMQEVYRIIAKVMNTDLTVLIEGESGTGKELAARAIHQLGSAKMASSLRWTWQRFLRWRSIASCSGQMESRVQSTRRAARFTSMRSAICRPRRRPNSSNFCGMQMARA